MKYSFHQLLMYYWQRQNFMIILRKVIVKPVKINDYLQLDHRNN